LMNDTVRISMVFGTRYHAFRGPLMMSDES
jgi:hypothetical protein